MGVFDHTAKDAFASRTQSQNIGRLLLRVVQHVYGALNSPRLLLSASEQWSSGGLPQEERIDRADLRLVYWQTARECREIILKALALLCFIEQKNGMPRNIDSIIELIGGTLDARESIRKRGMEFSEIHWAPIGTAPPPQPPYAMDVAMDVLLGGGSYPRLPTWLEETVKQVGLPDPTSILKIEKDEKRNIQRRVEDEVFAMWVLSRCPKTEAVIRFNRGKILFEVPHEFRVTAIFDFQRCQILQAEILVGSLSGLEVSSLINLGFTNVLRQAIGLQEARHRFAVDVVKRDLREKWREIAELVKRRRFCSLQSDEEQMDTIRVLDETILIEERNAQKLERELKEKLLFETSVDLGDEEISPTRSSRTAARCFDDTAIKGPPDYFNYFFLFGRWVSGGILLSVLRDQILRARSSPNVFPGGIFRYISHGSKALIMKTAEQEEIKALDGASRSAVEPERQAQQSSSLSESIGSQQRDSSQQRESNSSKPRFRALDIFFLSQFDQSCGGLLSPLLKIVLEYPSLFPWDFDSILTSTDEVTEESQRLISSSSQQPQSPPQGPALRFSSQTQISSLNLEESVAVVDGRNLPMAQLSGSGSILQFRLDDENGTWTAILWPLTAILWILDHSDEIVHDTEDIEQMQLNEMKCDSDHVTMKQQENHNDQPIDCETLPNSLQTNRITLTEYLEGFLPYDLKYVKQSLRDDSSCEYLRTFDASRLELSAWTRHAAAALSSLILSLIAGCLSRQSNSSVFSNIIDLRIGRPDQLLSDVSQSLSSTYSSSNVLSGYRSLKFCYFKKYCIQLHVQPFDGSLRIAFSQSEKRHKKTIIAVISTQLFQCSITAPSWVRLPGGPSLESELSASLRGCPAGVIALYRILPYLKFLAFVDLIRCAFLRRGLHETNSLYDYDDNPVLETDENVPTMSQTDLFLAGISSLDGIRWHYSDRKKKTKLIAEKERNVVISPAAESVELTRTLQELNRLKHPSNGYLETRLTFAREGEAGQVRILLNAVVRGDWKLVASYIVVGKSSTKENESIKLWSTVASLRVHHPPYEFDCLSDDLSQSLFDQYWYILQTKLSGTSNSLQHIVAVAALSSEDFPFVIRKLSEDSSRSKVGNETKGLTSFFSFDCKILKSIPSNWAERFLLWNLDQCIINDDDNNNHKRILKELNEKRLKCGIEVTTQLIHLNNEKNQDDSLNKIQTLDKKKELIVEARLTDHLRLPAFCFGNKEFKTDGNDRLYELDDREILRFVNVKDLEYGCYKSEQNSLSHWYKIFNTQNNQWISCREIQYKVICHENEEELESGSLTPIDLTSSSSHLSHALTVAYTKLFKLIKSTSSFLKAAILFQRVELIRRDIVVYHALPDCLSISWKPWSIRTGDNEINKTHLNTPIINIEWQRLSKSSKNSTSNNDDDLTTSIQLATSTIKIKSKLLKSILNDSRNSIERWLSISQANEWDLIRLLISTYELHSSIHLLTYSSPPTTLPSLNELIQGTKIAPLSSMISRINGSLIGSEILSFCPNNSSIPSPLARVITQIQVKFDVVTPPLPQRSANIILNDDRESLPSFLCLSIQIRVHTVQQFQHASIIMNRSLNEALTRLVESLTLSYQYGPLISSSSVPSTLLGLGSIDHELFNLHDRIDNSLNIIHQIYFHPGHLLCDVLAPLFEGVTVWLSSATIAASITNNIISERSGALNFARTTSISSGSHDETKLNKGTSIGKIRWRYPLQMNVIEDSHRNGNGTKQDFQAPEHSVELELVPRLGEVLPNHWPSSYNFRHHPIQPTSVMFSGTASVADASSSICSTGGFLASIYRVLWWTSLRHYIKTIQSIHSTDSLTSSSVIVSSNDDSWNWMKEFNILLASPKTLSIFSVEPISVDISTNRPENLSSLQSYCERLIQYWKLAIQNLVTNEGMERVIDDTIRRQARSVAESSFLDLVPDALVLPFEINGTQTAKQIDEHSESLLVNQEMKIERKRGRISNEITMHSTKRMKLNDSASFLTTTPSSDKELSFYNYVIKPPNLFLLSNWQSPLKPHSVIRADGKDLELMFESQINLIVKPSLIEWTVFSRYFKFFSRQQSVTDLALLTRAFSRGISSINAIADLAALLDLVMVSNELHLKHTQQMFRIISLKSNEEQYKHSNHHPIVVQLPLPPQVPFLQLEFRKSLSNRPRTISFLDIDLVVWNCLPLFHQFLSQLSSLLSNSIQIEGLTLYVPSMFVVSIVLPLPPTEQTPVTLNGVANLESLFETALARCPPPPPGATLSIQRPLPSVLSRFFTSGIPFDILKNVLSQPTCVPE